MSRKIDAVVARMLDQAEAEQACVASPNGSLGKALSRRVFTGELCRPLPGLYVRRELWNSESMTPDKRTLFLMRGLAKTHEDWVFCNASAAVVHGLPISYEHLGRVHVVSPTNSRTRSTARVRRHYLRDVVPQKLDHLRVTTLQQTAIDCMRSYGFRDALAVADATLRKTGMSKRDLLSFACDAGRGLTGMKTAYFALSHADGRSESGGESIARAVMLKLGFVLPELQVRVANPLDSRHAFRVDYLWILPNGTIIIGELDGRDKYIDTLMTHGRCAVNVLADERLRESLVSITGAKIMRFSFSDVIDERKFATLLETFGIPYARSLQGQAMMRTDAAMHGGIAAPTGAVIRSGTLVFESFGAR